MRKQKREKYHLWHKTPYDGVPGFYAAVQRLFYQFEGPAQLGDRGEPAYVQPADPKCPVCGHSMKLHRIDRGGPGKPTHLRCPKEPVAEGDGADENVAEEDVAESSEVDAQAPAAASGESPSR
ncbi:hypothetical protein [Leucobacter chromiireducens]|uniref:hypothetical protein n=1 Tax=Leucobacter chromiireducens TaxID=283877 RepID=UPI001F301D3C|nr:hypothetical protein [Leucobacter chromiireducens]